MAEVAPCTLIREAALIIHNSHAKEKNPIGGCPSRYSGGYTDKHNNVPQNGQGERKLAYTLSEANQKHAGGPLPKSLRLWQTRRVWGPSPSGEGTDGQTGSGPRPCGFAGKVDSQEANRKQRQGKDSPRTSTTARKFPLGNPRRQPQ